MRKNGTDQAREPETLTLHTLPAMRVAILFRPQLRRFSLEVAGSESFFIPSAWTDEERRTVQLIGILRDVFWLRDEFLRVSDERSALHFLRDTGDLTQDDKPLSWNTFRKWQTFTRSMMTARTQHDKSLPGSAPTPQKASVSDEITGSYWDNFFELPEDGGRDGDFTRRLLLMSMHAGFFAQPANGAYAIEFLPSGQLTDAITAKQMDSALRAFKDRLHQSLQTLNKTETQPVLVFRPECTMTAIAAVVWTERQAGLEWGRCPECRELFRLRAHKKKTYCDGPCKGTVKKRKTRKNNQDKLKTKG